MSYKEIRYCYVIINIKIYEVPNASITTSTRELIPVAKSLPRKYFSTIRYSSSFASQKMYIRISFAMIKSLIYLTFTVSLYNVTHDTYYAQLSRFHILSLLF